MKLSIIIVSWNVRDLLRECLHSLFAEPVVSRSEAEVIVVDNASRDGSAGMVRAEFPSVILTANLVNAGFGAANNQAFRHALGDYILLLNPDTVVVRGALETMVAVMDAQPRTGILGCRVLNPDGSYQLHSSGSQPTLQNIAGHFLFLSRIVPAGLRPPSLYTKGEPEEGAEVGWVSGACMLLRREALGDTIFDERFFLYCEDVDLCARVADAGWAVRITHRADIVHHDGRSFANADPETQLEKTRNLRRLFFERRGRLARIGFDAVVAAGFAMRAGVLALTAVVHRSGECGEEFGEFVARRARTRAYLREALSSLRSAGAR